MRIVSTDLRNSSHGLWDKLRDRLTDDSKDDVVRDLELERWLSEHSPLEALAEWAGWEIGDPSWATTFMHHFCTLVSCDQQYQTTTDLDFETRLEAVLEGSVDA